MVVLPLKKASVEFHRTLSGLPQEPSVIGAPGSRFLVSWWDREIHVWSLKKNATELLDINPEEIDINQNRKLLKTIVVKGDSNISSASINRDGTLLFVATTTDIKAFHLEHQDPETPSDIMISTIELPEKLVARGATRIKLSPDEKWLCVVQNGTRVVVANVKREAASLSFSIQKLNRIHRKIPRHISNGGLGSYERHVTHISFSPDSQVLAVTDLAGYIDTWVINSGGIGSNGRTDQKEDASSSEDFSSDEEDLDTDGRNRWTRNPRGELLTKLPASPVILSFSDLVPGHQAGNTPVVDDYILLVVTSSWQVLAFHPLQGSFTTWSRQHPKSALPGPFQGLLDTAKGVIWEGLRVWIYGVSFLSMIDMAQDLREPTSGTELVQEAASKKRKRDGPSTGAGGKMYQGNLVPHSIQKHVAGEAEEMDLDDPLEGDDNNSEDEMDDAANGELSTVRQNIGASGIPEVSQSGGERKKWWITYKYRPIFGIVPLSTAGDPLEVALVERPGWDLDMPERYLGIDN